MSAIPAPSEAAARVGEDWRRGEIPPARVLHGAAWILSRVGQPLPAPPDALAADQVAATAAAAIGDLSAVRARIDGAFRRSPREGWALTQGVAALGAGLAETVLDVALAQPEVHIGGANVAAGLARLRPERGGEWLDWLGRAASPFPRMEAVIELVIAARDRGQRDGPAEALWAKLGGSAAGDSATWWEGHLRMHSRKDPVAAAEELLDATALVGGKALVSAPFTLCRWARQDPEAAVRFVSRHGHRLGVWGSWARGLSFDGALDARADWQRALAEAEDAWQAGQLLAVAVRVGEPRWVEELAARRLLSGEDCVGYAATSLRLLQRSAPERAAAVWRALDGVVGEGQRPGELRDWLAVLADDSHEGPWWLPYLPGLS